MLNRTIAAAGGKTISNGSHQWACVRVGPHGAWYCYGTHGCLGATPMCSAWLVASPLSLHILEN